MMNLKAVGLWALARLAEPSTWVGIAGVVGSMTFLPHAADTSQQIGAIGAAVASAIGIIAKETGAIS